MILRNFLFRIGQYVRENRAKLFKALMIVVAIILAIFLIRYAVETIQRARYEKRINALETEIRQEEEKAKEWQRQADLLKDAIEVKYAQIEAIQKRAETAENNLRNARRSVAPLKEVYEEIRNTPMSSDPVPCANACEQLARLGYRCQ